MYIIKRNGKEEAYLREKIGRVMDKAFASVDSQLDPQVREEMLGSIEGEILGREDVSVEDIQDLVEKNLIERNFYREVRSFILYREEHKRQRRVRARIGACFASLPDVDALLKEIGREFDPQLYNLEYLEMKFRSLYKPGMGDREAFGQLIRAAVELTSKEAVSWEAIGERLYLYDFCRQLSLTMQGLGIKGFYEKLEYLTEKGLYGSYILRHYSKAEIEQAYGYLHPERSKLLSYSGLDLLIKRYVISSHQGVPLEDIQEMYLGIALHLAMKEKRESRMEWVRRFYDMLSSLKVTMATPTLANSRKPYSQLSSCFIDTVPDSLEGIYRSISNFAQVSKFGGGMGLYFGKVRARGSMIRGFEGAAGGVIRWIKLANDTAVAVDQLGVRQGAVAVYLDLWHRDLPEFLELRTNNGDDRMKAHDVFPGICCPDYFWRQTKENMEGDWYLMCPHQIQQVKGYCLEDYVGSEWERRYLECVEDGRISKKIIKIKDLVRLIIKSAVETGTPFVFNRDLVNAANPNKHKGMIYCSNLCTEIAQNMRGIEEVSTRVETSEGDVVVVNTTRPGDFVVCNLASLSLGNIDLEDGSELENLTASAVRALDNVIDLNFFPVEYARINNQRYRPVGLGVSGYHHMLAKRHISWESREHLDFVDKIFEKINYYAISASCSLAEEKGAYAFFGGSEWESGEYFARRGYEDASWQALRGRVAAKGMRNGYLLAIAPTSSTSVLAGTTAGLDPIMSRFFLEEKKNGLIPRVAPELDSENYWYYKDAHTIDQSWSVRAAGVRQRHIDQAQSLNLYITNDYTFRGVLSLYQEAWEQGVKTIYYIRSKSLEVEDCVSCSA